MDDHFEIQEDSFSSDEDFDDEDAQSTESSTDVDERIKNEEIFDRDFLKCYSALKRKDDKIYNKEVKFFHEKQDDEVNEQPETLLNLNKKASKPKMTLLDHQLRLKDDLVEEVEQFTMPGDDEDTVHERIKPMLSHYERELDDLKKEIIKAGENADSDSDGSDFLIRKDGSKKDLPIAATSRKSKIEAIPDDGDPDIKELKTLWSDPKQLSEEDKFLRDYILNKRYISSRDEDDEPNDGSKYFSKDIDKLSDIEPDEDEEEKKNKRKVSNAKFHSEEDKFDEIKRIPRNATKTIRDLNEKRLKKQKRLKRIEKRKKLKKKIDETEEEFRYRQGEEDNEELEKIMEELDKELNTLARGDLDAADDEKEKKKKKKKRKRSGQKKPTVGVAPDRLLSYGLSKRKLKKSKLL